MGSNRKEVSKPIQILVLALVTGSSVSIILASRLPKPPPPAKETIPTVSLGSTIAVRGEDENGRPLPETGNRIVISMSDCGSCSMLALDLGQLGALKTDVPLIMVYPDRRTLKVSPRIGRRVLDKEPSFLPAAMRTFRPHAALIDSNGSVLNSALGGADILQLVRESER